MSCEEEKSGDSRALSSQHNSTAEEQSRRTAGKGCNRRGVRAARVAVTLLAMGTTFQVWQCHFEAFGCWHVSPHGNHTTAHIPNNKQCFNSPSHGFLPRATQFPLSGAKNQSHRAPAQVLCPDSWWKTFAGKALGLDTET